jgi:glucose-1-phosphate cytidylyltransferase
MKVVILAGGFGTRLAEVTEDVPKPMIEIGGRPLLWHIMRHYASYGHEEFFVALGYRGEVVKRYFLDYHTVNGDLTASLENDLLARLAAAGQLAYTHEEGLRRTIEWYRSHLKGGAA